MDTRNYCKPEDRKRRALEVRKEARRARWIKGVSRLDRIQRAIGGLLDLRTSGGKIVILAVACYLATM